MTRTLPDIKVTGSRTDTCLWSRRLVIGAGLFLLLAGTTALGAIDSVLAAMHLSGGVGYGVTSLTGVGALWRPGQAFHAVDTWRAWKSSSPDSLGVGAPRLVYSSLAVDVLFIVGYATLLRASAHQISVLLSRHGQAVGELDEPDRRRLERRVERRYGQPAGSLPSELVAEQTRLNNAARLVRERPEGRRSNALQWPWTTILIAAAAFFDLLEDGTLAWLVYHGTSSLQWLLWSATLLKWLCIAIVFLRLGLALVALLPLYRDEVRGFGGAVKAARGPLLLALVFVFLTSTFDAQIVDVVLRWQVAPTRGLTNLVFGLALTGALSLTLIGVCTWLLRSRDERATIGEVDTDRLLLIIGAVAVTVGAGLLVATNDGGMGILVGGALAGVVGVVSLWLRHTSSRDGGQYATQIATTQTTQEDLGQAAAKSEIAIPLLVSEDGAPIEVDDDVAAPPVEVVAPVLTGQRTPTFVPRAVGSLPLIGLALALVRAGTIESLYGERWRFIGLVLLGLATLALALLLLLRIAMSLDWITDRSPYCFALLSVAVIAVWVAASPVAAGETMGSVGVIAAFLIAATLVVILVEIPMPATLFRLIGLRSTPVVTLLVLWLVIASFADRGDSYHNVRRVTDAHRAQSVSLAAGFNDWLAANGLQCYDHSPGGTGMQMDCPNPLDKTALEHVTALHQNQAVIPLVLISTAGGGIRAGYWTALVLDCLLDGGSEASTCRDHTLKDPADARSVNSSIFVESGISGGSLGLASYAAHIKSGRSDNDWVDHELGSDALAPTLAWGLLADLPNAFLRLNVWRDRATVLEQAWESEAPELRDDFLGPAGAHAPKNPLAEGLPFMMMNGTSVADGCQFNTSLLNFGVAPKPANPKKQLPAPQVVDRCRELPEGSIPLTGLVGSTKDITDYLCPNQDVRLSTAALLSARFPFITPAGRVAPCRSGTSLSSSYVVDGGYYEGSGIAPLRDVWATISPWIDLYNDDHADKPIVPVFIAIDNHYVSGPGPSGDPSPLQLLAPLDAVKSVRDGHDIADQQEMERTFSAFLPTSGGRERFLYFHPVSHPGVEAPLGWVLSSASRDDLRSQLKSETSDIAAARCWLTGMLCAPDVGSQ